MLKTLTLLVANTHVYRAATADNPHVVLTALSLAFSGLPFAMIIFLFLPCVCARVCDQRANAIITSIRYLSSNQGPLHKLIKHFMSYAKNSPACFPQIMVFLRLLN